MPRGYDLEERASWAHGALPEYRPRDPHGISGPGSEGGWQGQQRPPDGPPGQDALRQEHRPHVQPDARASPAANDAGGGRRGFAEHGYSSAPSPRDGYGRGSCDGLTGRSGFQHGAGQPQGGQGSTARTEPQDVDHAGPQDLVPRRDFDELSNLCRDLLLEQKRLRGRLEEREEREQLAEQERQQELGRRQQQSRLPREALRGGRGFSKLGGMAAGGGDRRPRASQAPSPASRIQGKSARDSAVRRDPKAKPSVAFGSTVSRLEQTRPVEKPRSAAGSIAVSLIWRLIRGGNSLNASGTQY